MNALIVAIALMLSVSATGVAKAEEPIDTLARTFDEKTQKMAALSVIFHDARNDKATACTAGYNAVDQIRSQGILLLKFIEQYPDQQTDNLTGMLKRVRHVYEVISLSVIEKCGTDRFLFVPKGAS